MLLLFLHCMLMGCASRGLKVADSDPAVRSGDALRVRFLARPVPEVRVVVDGAGNISLPLGVKLHVANMTLQEVGRAIEAAYRPSWPPELEVLVSRGP